MKKVFLMVIIVLILTGCKKEFTCKRTLEQNDLSVETKIDAKFKGSRLKDFKITYTFTNESEANKVCESVEGANCNKNIVSFNDISAMKMITESPNNFKEITKREFKSLMKDLKFSCK